MRVDKACDRCVSVCPAGSSWDETRYSLNFRFYGNCYSSWSLYWCNDCELSCPDFAIFVADKKSIIFKIKWWSKAKTRENYKNNYKILDEDKKVWLCQEN